MDGSFVVAWDFELEESEEIVRDGVMFRDLVSAKAFKSKKMLESLDSDFSQRVASTFSRRLGKSGYVRGNVDIYLIRTGTSVQSLEDALSGKGISISDE